ncbi:Zn-dependent hydrolase [Aurantimonas sp. A3-2-R12]|uniref:Zn-dependent hydrolase n=1 Tax=Aurantimonas sp. A3-2-R12 TaxID=3114362 RepID=UPI002E170550|nr:Zn-dependent hydrolase [Aurantimonas sp. A3-2-R12]
MPSATAHIDLSRLQALLAGVNGFGRNPRTRGFNRIGFSEADMAVRDWFADAMAADGLAVRRDGAANIFGRFGPADGPAIITGSHLDTVPEGGAFDGALGACVALECVRAMRDAGLSPTTAIEVVATAEEEGRFGGMLGSQAIAGQVTQQWIDQARDADGVTLVAAMRAHGLDPCEIMNAARAPSSVRAFLELHIEQGPVLEAAGIPIGIADSVSGISHLFVRLDGTANHSGTTPMDMRADAFAGLAEVAGAIPAVIDEIGGEQSRITIGKVDLTPNAPHTIPGTAEFSVIIRDISEAIMRRLTDRLRSEIAAVAARHNLTSAIEDKSWLPPVALDRELASLLAGEAAKQGIAVRSMPSGAGHDAQTMQALCPSALIFVPSKGGISHAPDEATAWPDIEKGANLLLGTLVSLAV